MKTNFHLKNVFNPIAITVFIITTGSVLGALHLEYISAASAFAGSILSILIASAIKIADQWEKGVVLRMGKFSGLKGPGLFVIIPIIDRVATYIDQRVRVTDFKAE